MAQATYIQNASSGYTTDLTRDRGVFSGHKHFQIKDASTIGETFEAVDLPVDGDPFDALHPNCKARTFTPALLPGSHGMWKMRVGYGEDIGEDVTPAEGLELTTTLEQSRSSVNVNESWDEENPFTLTNDGVGVPKLINVLSLQVIQYSTNLPDLAPLMALSDSPKINKKPLTLIRFLGVEDATISFEAKQLLYAGFSIAREGGYFVVRHELQARRSWENKRHFMDSNNKPTGVVEISDVYEPVDFVGKLGQ